MKPFAIRTLNTLKGVFLSLLTTTVRSLKRTLDDSRRRVADVLLDTLHDPHEDETRRVAAARALHHLGMSSEAQRGVVAWHSSAMGEGFAKIRGGGGAGYAVAGSSSYIHSLLFDHRVPGTHSFIHSFMHSPVEFRRLKLRYTWLGLIQSCDNGGGGERLETNESKRAVFVCVDQWTNE